MIFYKQGEEGQAQGSESPTKQIHSHGSPVKTVLASLQRHRGGPNDPKGGQGGSIKVQ